MCCDCQQAAQGASVSTRQSKMGLLLLFEEQLAPPANKTKKYGATKDGAWPERGLALPADLCRAWRTPSFHMLVSCDWDVPGLLGQLQHAHIPLTVTQGFCRLCWRWGTVGQISWRSWGQPAWGLEKPYDLVWPTGLKIYGKIPVAQLVFEVEVWKSV